MRRSVRPQSRHHFWAYDEDWAFITDIVAPKSQMTSSTWVREVLHKIVTQVREQHNLQRQAATALLAHTEKKDSPL